jgi:hypothetical protein
MKVIIAGSRTIKDRWTIYEAIHTAAFPIHEVVCGGARGVDTVGRHWGKIHGIPVCEFPADWERYGRGAGAIRNTEMGDYADALIAVWDGKSPGTNHMVTYMRKIGKPVYVKVVQ